MARSACQLAGVLASERIEGMKGRQGRRAHPSSIDTTTTPSIHQPPLPIIAQRVSGPENGLIKSKTSQIRSPFSRPCTVPHRTCTVSTWRASGALPMPGGRSKDGILHPYHRPPPTTAPPHHRSTGARGRNTSAVITKYLPESGKVSCLDIKSFEDGKRWRGEAGFSAQLTYFI